MPLHLRPQTRTSRLRRVLTAVVVSAVLVFTGVQARTAVASTDTYCSGCTILGNPWTPYNFATTTNFLYVTLDYVHRLSGPAGSAIGAQAKYHGPPNCDAGKDCWGSAVTGTDVAQHGFCGCVALYGYAWNYGNGNYGFNAHDDY